MKNKPNRLFSQPGNLLNVIPSNRGVSKVVKKEKLFSAAFSVSYLVSFIISFKRFSDGAELSQPLPTQIHLL